ncbi:MAG: UDP-3-O-[3-hydroxymyristoyl] N-acetylglucosamine deacetylase [Candidatus Omnitrophica bacterium]|nr:UDP-3-O-[3-hydroxymyristoyl] N-acetylglucosamine deacetylase [Candidatus Omnitrophota bacterium]
MGTSISTQKTIAREGSISGRGLHTGERAVVFLRPAPPHSGIRFYRKGEAVSANRFHEGRQEAQGSLRATSIGLQSNRVQTVEHLLAAFLGLGISNAEVTVEGPEVPGLDGSAADFVKALKELGTVDQSEKEDCWEIPEPLFCHETHKAVCVYPAEEFKVSYILNYDHPYLEFQKAEFTVTPQVFEKEIAPARTFCTEAEAAQLRSRGLGRGATYQNTLVISEKGAVQNEFRFENECARHKVLDLLGDLNLLGFRILGHVVALRSGHSLNQKLVEQIQTKRAGYA